MISYFLAIGRYFYLPFLFFRSPSKKNPLRWDENIALPFPLLKTLLTRYQQKEGLEPATEFAKFLIENRPIQRKAAQRALVFLATDQMRAFTQPQQIAGLSRELSFMPAAEELPEEYQRSLAPLLDIAGNTQKALQEYNLTNRLRLLRSVLQQLVQYQKEINLSKGRFAFAFGQVSQRWQQVIGRAVAEIEQQTGLPLVNPFITGNPIRQEDSEIFVGRGDIINQLQTEALREGASGAILFTGNRRTGKTSTLLNLKQFLPSTLASAYFNCQSPLVHTDLRTLSHTAQQVIQKTLRLPAAATPPSNLAELTRSLAEVNNYLLAKDRYLLLCFDEYERLGPLIRDGRLAGLADSFRYWMQEFPRLILLFAGSHQLDELESIDWTDYLINVRTVFISYLDEAAALQLVTSPVPEFDMEYETEDLPHRLVDRLGRQPYLIQCTMYELVEHLNDDSHRKLARAADLEVAISRMFQTADSYFSHFWYKELADAERDYLLRLAQGKTVATESAAAKRLMKKEIISANSSGAVFCVPVLQEWTLRNF